MSSTGSDKEPKTQSKYTKSQRIAAFIGIILLIALYIVTLISAITTSPAAPALFRACMFASALIPLSIFCYIKIGRLLSGR
jgi:magnesium-transporting ATPase (P-type)